MTAIVVIFAGLFGAAGIAGAALAAHGGDIRLVAIAAGIALVHAPALLGISALRAALPKLSAFAGGAMIVGTLLFSGDLAARTALGGRLFVNAAPTGGMVLIAAWLLVAIGGVVLAVKGRRERL